MTINTPDPYQDEPIPLEDLGREVFDLVDDTVVDLSDEQIDERLQAALTATGYDPDIAASDLQGDAVRRMTLAEIDIDSLNAALDSTGMDTPDVCMAEDILTIRAAAEAELRRAREDAEHIVAAAQQRADRLTAKADAYVDQLLDQAREEVAKAQQTASRTASDIIAVAERKARRLLAAAEHEAAEARRRAELRHPAELHLADMPTNRAEVQVLIGSIGPANRSCHTVASAWGTPANARFFPTKVISFKRCEEISVMACTPGDVEGHAWTYWDPPSSALQAYNAASRQMLPYAQEQARARATAVAVAALCWLATITWQGMSSPEGSVTRSVALLIHWMAVVQRSNETRGSASRQNGKEQSRRILP